MKRSLKPGWPLPAPPYERRRAVNLKQANGLGVVHVAMPQMKQTFCGRPIDPDEWVTTKRGATCTACARFGAPREAMEESKV